MRPYSLELGSPVDRVRSDACTWQQMECRDGTPQRPPNASPVSGEGKVSGGDGLPPPIQADQAALWAPGEPHESSTRSGTIAAVVDAQTSIELCEA